MALFLGNDDLKTLTIVKNNGSIEVLTKTSLYDKSTALTAYKRQFKKYVKSNADKEIDNAINHFLSSGKGGIQWLKN